jgi:hypothetical protein
MDDKHILYIPPPHLTCWSVPAGFGFYCRLPVIGKIIYEKGRFKQKGGGFLQRYLRVFAQEGLGRPDLELEGEIDAVRRSFKKQLPDQELPGIQGVMVFTNEKADLEEIGEPPILIAPAKKLKELIRKKGKEKPLAPLMLQEIQEVLPEVKPEVKPEAK